jgi:hypothetical protein
MCLVSMLLMPGCAAPWTIRCVSVWWDRLGRWDPLGKMAWLDQLVPRAQMAPKVNRD